MKLLLIAFLGGLGALCRDQVDQYVRRRWPSDFPWGILFVNGLGSFLLGLLIGLFSYSGIVEPWAFYVGFGFLGAFTTFSTWMYQSVEHLLENRVAIGLRVIIFMTVFGLLAAVVGVLLGTIVL